MGILDGYRQTHYFIREIKYFCDYFLPGILTKIVVVSRRSYFLEIDIGT